jgi:hypothetical protein
MMSMAPPGSTVKQVSDETMTRCRPRLHEPLCHGNAMGVAWEDWNILEQFDATDCWILDVTVVLINSIGLYRTC